MIGTHRHGDHSLTIRPAAPSDHAALARLAQLDSAPSLREAPVLVAEIDGELVAAMPRDGREPIANPFRHTAGVVALLEARAAELESVRRAPRRRWQLGSLRASVAGRA